MSNIYNNQPDWTFKMSAAIIEHIINEMYAQETFQNMRIWSHSCHHQFAHHLNIKILRQGPTVTENSAIKSQSKKMNNVSWERKTNEW